MLADRIHLFITEVILQVIGERWKYLMKNAEMRCPYGKREVESFLIPYINSLIFKMDEDVNAKSKI